MGKAETRYLSISLQQQNIQSPLNVQLNIERVFFLFLFGQSLTRQVILTICFCARLDSISVTRLRRLVWKGLQAKAIKFETFCEEWFEEYAKPNLRNTTYEKLLQLRKRVYVAIGHLQMNKITPRQIQTFVNALSKEGTNERTEKPLAPKTIRHNLSLISDAFSYAVKIGAVADNPCTKVTIQKKV